MESYIFHLASFKAKFKEKNLCSGQFYEILPFQSEEYYRQLETFSKEPLVAELKNAAVCDGTKGRKVVVSSVLVEENADGAVISEDAENFANFVGNIEWQTSENVSDSKVTAIVGQPTEQEIDNASITEPEDRLNKNESSLPEKPAFFSKVYFHTLLRGVLAKVMTRAGHVYLSIHYSEGLCL